MGTDEDREYRKERCSAPSAAADNEVRTQSNEVRTGKHAFDLVTMSPIREGTIPKPFLQMNSGSLDPMEFTVFQKITHSWEIECTGALNEITVSHQATMA